jgi:type II secretory pathway pseudopilin PulG
MGFRPKEDFVQNDLLVVVALFGCSLAAAVVLFKILKSTAVIQKKEYQVGGAAAGFLVIYAALYGSYHQLQERSLAREAQDQTLAACKASLLEDVTIQGTINPPIKQATVILGRDSTTADDSGRFSLKTKGAPQSVYVIKEGVQISHTIFPDEDLKAIKIP